MNGLDVLKQCQGYAGDVTRLRVALASAMDGATGATAAMNPNGGGRPSEKLSRQERFAVRADTLSRRLSAREAMRDMELEEAARLLELIPPEQAEAIYERMIAGRLVREMAERRGKTQDAVRALLRRGKDSLRPLPSSLGEDLDYQDLRRQYLDRLTKI